MRINTGAAIIVKWKIYELQSLFAVVRESG
jgi:hypothetical protein